MFQKGVTLISHPQVKIKRAKAPREQMAGGHHGIVMPLVTAFTFMDNKLSHTGHLHWSVSGVIFIKYAKFTGSGATRETLI